MTFEEKKIEEFDNWKVDDLRFARQQVRGFLIEALQECRREIIERAIKEIKVSCQIPECVRCQEEERSINILTHLNKPLE